MKSRKPSKARAITVRLGAVILLWALLPTTPVLADHSQRTAPVHHQVIPILGVTFNQAWEPAGIVVELIMRVEQRKDHEGFHVKFESTPGRFSSWSQQSVIQAIFSANKAAGLSLDSWTVTLIFPYWDVTIYGDSLSAMVALSVVALAIGDTIPPDRVLTGTITPEGHIGVVGGVPYKIHAAYADHFHRVLIPEERDVADGDWQTPFLMQVSPVGTVNKAYYALTGHPLHTRQIPSASVEPFPY